MSKRFITLLRHGKVDGPAALYGHTDITLSAQGNTDLFAAINTVQQQRPITHIISSPLIRCAQPAQEFAEATQLPLQIIDDLKEMFFGHWDGIAFDQFDEAHWPALHQFWDAPASAHAPAGEALQQFVERVMRGWDLIANNTDAEHQLVICHGGVIRIIIALVLNLDWRNAALFKQLHIDYASHTRIEFGDMANSLPIIKWIGVTTE